MSATGTIIVVVIEGVVVVVVRGEGVVVVVVVRVYPFLRVFMSSMIKLIADSPATELCPGEVGDV